MEEGYNINAIEIELNELFKTIPSGSLPILHETLERSIKKLHEPMQLAIIGKISSSKSTLVNAILGKDGVMATGQMEVTYNVGWLKYGAPESDIIIHHKDGSPDSYRKPEEFLRWTIESDGRKELLNNVSYIETFDDAEILREINIIDTPGLDAVRGQDSQNTLDFLKHVRPDAVIMLFTNSVAENTLKVVQAIGSQVHFSLMKKFADQGRAYRNVGYVLYFYIAGICFGADHFYANFFPIAYIILETFAAVVPKTMVIADNQVFYLVTFF